MSFIYLNLVQMTVEGGMWYKQGIISQKYNYFAKCRLSETIDEISDVILYQTDEIRELQGSLIFYRLALFSLNL